MGGTIFISYRRGADSGFAGRLYDRLENAFGRDQVFIDVDSIAPGEDFVAILEEKVGQCDVLLALIGRGWLAATDEAGQRRLDNPDDFVRIEIGAALAQSKRVVPVLTDDVGMPRGEDLPEEIKPLARRNAIRLTHERFKDDAARLVRAVEKALADAEAARQAEEAARGKEEEEASQRRKRERERAAAEAEQRAKDEERWRAEQEAVRRNVEEAHQRRELERQRAEEEAHRQAKAEAASRAEEERQRAAAEAKRQAEDEERQRVERERQRAEAEAKREAEEKDHWRTDEEKRQGTGGSSSANGRKWMIGAALVLSLGMGAIFLWPSPEQPPVSPVTSKQQAVAPSRSADARTVTEERASALQTFQDCAVCPEMVALPGGTFLMGSPAGEEGRYLDEGPQHEVTISPFAIGKYEVTFKEWDACVAAGGCNGYRPDDEGWGRGQRPVVNVSWNDAKAYCDWLANQTGMPCRLPSEAEWEYAARAGTTTPFFFGTTITGNDANFNRNVGKTTEVGSFPANPWGLYDMRGNVWEWVEDGSRTYTTASVTDPIGPAGAGRVLRGGSWNDSAQIVRSAIRFARVPDYRLNFIGFRCARVQS